jgi:hypothetical protein
VLTASNFGDRAYMFAAVPFLTHGTQEAFHDSPRSFPVRRTLTTAGLVATSGLLASALTVPAQAAPSGSTTAGPTIPAKDAKAVVLHWLADNHAALKDATEYRPDYKVTSHTAKLKSTGAPSTDGKAGLVAPIGEEKKSSKSKNVNLPKTIGKVFFTLNDKPYWCSATSVQSKYRNLVATAGHCAYNTDVDDHVLDNWVFVPGYYQGKAVWGIYPAKQAFTHYDFDVYEDYDRDYAFVSVYNGITVKQVSKCSREEYDAYAGPKWTYNGNFYKVVLKDAGRLGDNVGGQGFAYNIKPGKYVYAFGYPAGPHADGNKPYTGITPKWVYGKTSKVVVDSALKIEEQIGLKASVTYGFDGAPWLLKYSNVKRLGYINGVTSTFIDSDDNDRYDYIGSPFFDGETAGVYKAAANVWSGTIVPPGLHAWFAKVPQGKIS